jgi:hypothetical protein
VKQIEVHCIHPAEPASDDKTVQDALKAVLDRVDRPDGWAISDRYRTGLAAYAMWAEALDTGRANRDGEAYVNQVWLECRDKPVEFLGEAKARVPGRCDAAFEEAIGHYCIVRDKLHALAQLHPERPGGWDWTTTFASPEGAALVREAAEAERQGIDCLTQIASALSGFGGS